MQIAPDVSVQATHLKEITLSNLDTNSVTYYFRDSEPLIPDTNLSSEMLQKDFFITPLAGILEIKRLSDIDFRESSLRFFRCHYFDLIIVSTLCYVFST